MSYGYGVAGVAGCVHMCTHMQLLQHDHDVLSTHVLLQHYHDVNVQSAYTAGAIGDRIVAHTAYTY